VLSIRTFALLMMWLAESVQAAIPLRLEVDSAYENGKVAIVGRTNLPDGTDLIAKIFREESNFSDDYKVRVADGRFRVPLAPGRYTLRPDSPNSLPRAGQQTATVTPDRFTQVSIQYDTGIR